MVLKITNQGFWILATFTDDEGNVIDRYVVDQVLYENQSGGDLDTGSESTKDS